MTVPPPTDRLAALVHAVAGPRAARPRLAGGRLSLVVDAGGLDDAGRAAMEARLRAALDGEEGVDEVRIAFTAERGARRILAVASGKGGVGKSTVAANVAIALARAGVAVGLVDADIYGPSLPRMLAADAVRAEARDKRLIPVATRWGVSMLSMGQLVEPGRAIAWRGPMAAGALTQMVEADWGPADLLVVDMPPGTGDVQLTMVQKHRPTAALIVSTPQDLALIDARRAVDLFDKAGVAIAGLVENMSGYLCPHCGEESDPFGHGGAEAEAAARGLPFLGRVPLHRAVLDAGEAGVPVAAGDGPQAASFHRLAARLAAVLDLPVPSGV